MELDWDPSFSVSQMGVLEWDLDGECAGEGGAAELAEPAGDAALMGLGSSGPAPSAICASLQDSRLVAQVSLSRRYSPSPAALQVWKSYDSGP